MIVSFGSKDSEKIWNGIPVKKPSFEIQEIARRKLRILHNSQNITDLRIPPSHRLEKLSGNLKDYYSIRINNPWKIIFIWENESASEVQIIDCH